MYGGENHRRAEAARARRKVSELSREQGLSMASTCARKSEYAGLAVSQLKRLKWQEPG